MRFRDWWLRFSHDRLGWHRVRWMVDIKGKRTHGVCKMCGTMWEYPRGS